MTRTRNLLALAGILTGIAGLVASELAAAVLQANNGTVSAIADGVGDILAGGPAMDLGHLVGPVWDKRLLVMGVVAFALIACGWVGTQARKRPMLPDLVYVALAAIGLAAVLYLPNSNTASLIATVVGLVTWVITHRLLTESLVAGESTSTTVDESTRRQFLIRAGIGAGAIAVSGTVTRFASRKKRQVEAARKSLDLAITSGSVPSGANLSAPGLGSWRTSNQDFYLIDTAFTKPAIPPADWRLRIHGMVDRELTLTYDDLISRNVTEDWVTLCCVSNEVGGDLIGNAYWSGFLIRDILAEAGVQAGATAVKQTSDDGWTCGTPIEALTDDRNAMLAIAMNGEPLPIEHGFPVRMVVPGLYGFVSATKWVVDLEVTTFDAFDAYWTQRGWSAEGPILTQSRIESPRNGSQTGTGSVPIGGSAWAQHTGIAKVEYQVDGGAWQEATLGSVPDVDTWVQWSGNVEVTRGRHELVVRATDKSGYTQTPVYTDVIPSGATGWHRTEFTAN